MREYSKRFDNLDMVPEDLRFTGVQSEKPESHCRRHAHGALVLAFG